jgi:predicted enzyme related to lactoylglutathione lyase
MGNQVGWFEVVGRDQAALKRFYGDMFDWKLEDAEGMPYTMVDPEGRNGLQGGIGPDPSGGEGHVTFYVEVDGLEGSLSRAEELGGTKITDPIDIPNGRIAHFADPEGHLIGLLEST